MNSIRLLWIKVWSWLKPILTIKSIYSFLTSKVFLIILVLILFLMIGRLCARSRDFERIKKIQEQNLLALTDSIKFERKRSGMMEISIAGYIATQKELKDINNDLYEQVKKEKGQVISLTNAVIELRQTEKELKNHINYLESRMDNPIKINDSLFIIPWGLKYDWDNVNNDFFGGRTYITLKLKPGYVWRDAITPPISFNSKISNNNIDSLYLNSNVFVLNHYKTELIDRISQIDLTFKEKVEKGKYRIYFETKYPGFTAKSLEGVMIDPNTNPYIKSLLKRKKIFPNMWSVGVGPSFGYNVFSNKIYLGIGVNINYNLLQW